MSNNNSSNGFNWIEQIATKRRAQATNVYICETYDFKRIDQMRRIIQTGDINTLFKPIENFRRRIEWDLQRFQFGEITEKGVEYADESRSDAPLSVGRKDAMIDKDLQSTPTVVIVKYVVTKDQADMLVNSLVAWSHDRGLFQHSSTVIVFTARLDFFPEPVRRLCYAASIVPSLPEERRRVLQDVVNRLDQAMKKKYGDQSEKRQTVTEWLSISPEIVSASAGLTLYEAETAALESFNVHRRFLPEAFTSYKINILRNMNVDYVEPKRGFESIAGYGYLKEYLMQRLIKPIRHPEIAEKYGLDIPRGILLVGIPGTGKTYFAQRIAKEAGLSEIELSSSSFLRGVVGETEARVRQVWLIIDSMAPCILFIDEVDELFPRREAVMQTDSGVRKSMQNDLYRKLGSEDRRVFTICATNLVGQVDKAALRRFGEIILLPPPDVEGRKAVLALQASMRKVPVANINYEEIARKTHLWTADELTRLVLEAASMAMEQEAANVAMSHFDAAMETVNINLGERESTLKKQIKEIEDLEMKNQRMLDEAKKLFIKTDVSRAETINI